jgi:hypothetical protein
MLHGKDGRMAAFKDCAAEAGRRKKTLENE